MMRRVLALFALMLVHPVAQAIPVYDPPAVIGYTVEVQKYNGWGGGALGIFGKKKKKVYVPIYAAAPVPEPSTYALMACGLGMVGFKAWSRRRAIR